MVSQFINRNKPVEELTTVEEPITEEDQDQPTNRDIGAVSDPENADADKSCETDLQEIEEFLSENEDVGKVRPLKKRPRMMEIPYSTGV